MKTLEDFSEEEIQSARKELVTGGLVAHFGGEIGFLCGQVWGIVDLMTSKDPDYIFRDFGAGLAAYGIGQALAFYIMSVTTTKEESVKILNTPLEELENKKNRGKPITGILERKFAEFTKYRAENYDKMEKRFVNYLQLRKDCTNTYKKLGGIKT